MIILKDINNSLGDLKIKQHSLNNDTHSVAYNGLNQRGELDKYGLDMYFRFTTGQTTNHQMINNTHYHIVSLAHLEPPFILNPLITEKDYYPVFWMAEYVKDENSGVAMPTGKIPGFYGKNNTFFLAMQRHKEVDRFEELWAVTLQSYNAMRCDIFYQEAE